MSRATILRSGFFSPPFSPPGSRARQFTRVVIGGLPARRRAAIGALAIGVAAGIGYLATLNRRRLPGLR